MHSKMGRVVLTVGLILLAGASAPANAGWTQLALPGDMGRVYLWARACVIPEQGGFGPVWRVRLQVQRNIAINNQRIGLANVRAAANNVIVSNNWNDQWLFNVVAGVDNHASRIAALGDRINFYASNAQGVNTQIGVRVFYDPATLARC